MRKYLKIFVGNMTFIFGEKELVAGELKTRAHVDI